MGALPILPTDNLLPIYLLPIRNVGSLCLALHLNLLHILFALV